MKISGIFALLFLFLSSCGIQDGGPNGVFIRVQNNSDINFENVSVHSGNAEQTFRDILSDLNRTTGSLIMHFAMAQFGSTPKTWRSRSSRSIRLAKPRFVTAITPIASA